jgi:hypothetical protein
MNEKEEATNVRKTKRRAKDLDEDKVNEVVWRAAQQALHPNDPLPNYVPNINNDNNNDEEKTNRMMHHNIISNKCLMRKFRVVWKKSEPINIITLLVKIGQR